MKSVSSISLRCNLCYSPCILILTILLLLSACNKSLEHYKEEGEGITRSLIQELKGIHTRKDIINSAQRLTMLFNDLSDVMIASHEYQESHHLSEIELTHENHDLSEQLRIELNRVYLLSGKDIIEKCQEQALQKLDAYKKKPKRRKV